MQRSRRSSLNLCAESTNADISNHRRRPSMDKIIVSNINDAPKSIQVVRPNVCPGTPVLPTRVRYEVTNDKKELRRMRAERLRRERKRIADKRAAKRRQRGVDCCFRQCFTALGKWFCCGISSSSNQNEGSVKFDTNGDVVVLLHGQKQDGVPENKSETSPGESTKTPYISKPFTSVANLN